MPGATARSRAPHGFNHSITSVHGARSILSNAGQLAGARVVAIGLRFVYVLFLARLLAPELYGQYAALQAFYVSFLAIAAFGSGPVLQRRLAREQDRAAVLGEGQALSVVLTMVAAATCASAGIATEDTGRGQTLILILALGLVGRGLSVWADLVFIAHEKARGIVGQEGLFRPLEVGLGIALLLAGGGIHGVVILHAAMWWLQGVRGLWLIRRRLGAPSPRWGARALWRLLLDCSRYGVPAVINAWTLQLPLILARHSTLTATELGQVALAYQVFLVGLVLPSALAATSLPIISRSMVRGDGKAFRFLKAVVAFALVAGAAAVALADASGPAVVEILFGRHYALAGGLLGWTLASVALTLVMTPFGVVRAAHGFNALTYAAGPIKLAVLVAVWFALPESLAFERPFMALLASQLAGCPLGVLNLRRLSPGGLVRALVWPFVAAVTALAAYFVLEPKGPFVALAAAFVILAPCVPYLVGKSPELRAMLFAWLPDRSTPRPSEPEDGPAA